MNELIKKVAKKADQDLDFNKIVGGIAGRLLELFDGKIIEGALTFGIEKIPEEYHDELAVIMEAYISGDYSKVQFESIDRLNKAIDLPILDEEDEEILLEGIVGSFFKLIKKKTLQLKNADPGQGPPEGDPD